MVNTTHKKKKPDLPRNKLGHIANPDFASLPKVLDYATGPLPAPPNTIAPPPLEYSKALNDQYGDCEVAEQIHITQVTAWMTHEAWTYPGDPAVESTYFGLTGGQDTGLMTTDVLKASVNPGLFGHKWDVYGAVDITNLDHIKTCVAWYGAMFASGDIPAVAQDQFQNGQPWDTTGNASIDNNIEGGHAFPIAGYDANYLYVITWGAIQRVTYRWWAKYGREGYAIITNALDARHGDGRGINITQLRQDVGLN